MNDQARGLALILGVLLALPSAEQVLTGSLPIEQGVLRLVASLAVTLTGMSVLSWVVRVYQADVEAKQYAQERETGTGRASARETGGGDLTD